jgi:hypothetical protein
LQASGASPFTFCASAISTCRPGQLEPVVHEARAVHRLDRRADRLAMPLESSRQPEQTVGIRRRGTNLDRRSLTVKQMEVETLAAEIQTGVQHRNGPPLR